MVPTFMKGFPEVGLPAAWDEMKALEMSNTALPMKTKQLISVAVAAQVPCRYCIYADTQFAKASGATDRELREAIMMAGLTRHWSTVLNGSQIDPAAFDREVAGIMKYAQTNANGTPAAPAEPITDAASAYKDIERTFGTVPMFLKAFPQVAIAPAWRGLKEVQLNPATALDNKTKEMIGLAVAAQIPCKFCVTFHTQAAKMNGATDEELKEAIAMAALTREFSTVIQGSLPDEAQFRREVDTAVKNMRTKEQKAPAAAQR
jgi:AhpD family alkylhydroperoxidase